MNRLEKIQMKDIFTTITKLADDCLCELESDTYEESKDETDTLLEIKVGRITDEINLFNELILDS